MSLTTQRGAVVGGLVLGLAVVAGGIQLTRRGALEGAGPAAAPEALEVPHGDVPCASGLVPIAAGGCFAQAPAASGAVPELLVYLHGLYDKPHEEEELDRQRRVAHLAVARGISVLALRGKIGVCAAGDRASPYITWWCWPSNERAADAGAGFVTQWEPAFAAAERRAGKGRRYILGFSNGAYFATLLSVRALIDADAFAVAHGGPVEPTRAYGRRAPMLLLSADEDVAQGEMMKLESELRADHWPIEVAAREGGHALTDSDIEMALGFFTRTKTENVPFATPISTHIPVHRIETDSGPGSGPGPGSALDAGLPPESDNPF